MATVTGPVAPFSPSLSVGVDRLLADAHAAAVVPPALDQRAGELVHQPHEIGDEQVGRALVDVARRADLLHGAPC